MFFDHFGKGAAHAQFGKVPVVQIQQDGSVVECFDEEVGNDLLQVAPHDFSQRTARTRVQPRNFLNRFPE